MQDLGFSDWGLKALGDLKRQEALKASPPNPGIREKEEPS
jgi:hypothetical protein